MPAMLSDCGYKMMTKFRFRVAFGTFRGHCLQGMRSPGHGGASGADVSALRGALVRPLEAPKQWETPSFPHQTVLAGWVLL